MVDSSATWMIDGSGLCVLYPTGLVAPQHSGNLCASLPLNKLHGLPDKRYLPDPILVNGSAKSMTAIEETDFGASSHSHLLMHKSINTKTWRKYKLKNFDTTCILSWTTQATRKPNFFST